MEIFPTDGKVGARFKGDGKKGQQVVWVEDTQAREENGTGQVHEMNEVAHQQEVGWGVGELTKRGFGRARTEPGSMIGFTPPTIQFRI